MVHIKHYMVSFSDISLADNLDSNFAKSYLRSGKVHEIGEKHRLVGIEDKKEGE